MRRATALTPILALALLAAPGWGRDAGSGTFDLSIRGIRAATLEFTAEENGDRYSAAASLQSAGLAALVRSISFDVAATGAIGPGGPQPGRYTETADLGSRQTAAEVVWRRGVPEVLRNEPARAPRASDIDPATQSGTIDPLTAIFAGLRDQPRAAICTTDAAIFDGRRRSRVRLSAPVAQGDTITCKGRYERVAGFSQREMADRTAFPFEVTYVAAADGMMRASVVSLDTILGPARLTRR